MNKILVLLSVLVICQCSLKEQKVTDSIELEVEIDGVVAGKLKVGLFGGVVPKTVANFVGICKGD